MAGLQFDFEFNRKIFKRCLLLNPVINLDKTSRGLYLGGRVEK